MARGSFGLGRPSVDLISDGQSTARALRRSTNNFRRESTSARDAALALDPIYDRPEGVTNEQWERLMEARRQKILQEDDVRRLSIVFGEMTRHLSTLTDADEAVRRGIEATLQALGRHREACDRRRRNVEVPLHIKQGLVEIDLDPLDGGKAMEDAALLRRTLVEEVNEIVRRHGQAKVEVLVGIKDIRVWNYKVEWENKRNEMREEDLISLIKHLQLLRVTKALQEFIKSGGEDVTQASEVAALESRLEHNSKLQGKKLLEKLTALKKIETREAEIVAETEVLREKVRQLQQQQETEQQIRSTSLMSTGKVDRIAEARMRNVVAKRQLQDIAKEQAETIVALQQELEKLRMKTFPSFAERRLVGGPDDRAVDVSSDFSVHSSGMQGVKIKRAKPMNSHNSKDLL